MARWEVGTWGIFAVIGGHYFRHDAVCWGVAVQVMLYLLADHNPQHVAARWAAND